MRIADILSLIDNKLNLANIENHFFESRMLLEHATNQSKEWIMAHIMEDISETKVNEILKLADERILGMPLQYIIGSTWFMGNEFFVNDNVLIPRADTEVWVEKVIELIKKENKKDVLDLCTGSGCIAISLKKALNDINVTGIDISEKALEVASKNAVHNDVEIDFIKSDLLSEIRYRKFDVIVSNPPYIPKDDILKLQKEVLHEPVIALDGGDDGLDFYRKIIKESNIFLKSKGYLALEFGYDQVENIKEILQNENFEICEIIKDYSGNTRSILSKRGNGNEQN